MYRLLRCVPFLPGPSLATQSDTSDWPLTSCFTVSFGSRAGFKIFSPSSSSSSGVTLVLSEDQGMAWPDVRAGFIVSTPHPLFPERYRGSRPVGFFNSSTQQPSADTRVFRAHSQQIRPGRDNQEQNTRIRGCTKREMVQWLHIPLRGRLEWWRKGNTADVRDTIVYDTRQH